MSMSFRDLPLLCATIGGSLIILLRKGCCRIKCQFCISRYLLYIRHWWTIFWDERHADSRVLFTPLLKGKFSVLKFNLSQGSWNQSFGIPSFLEMCFTVWNHSFERSYCGVCPEKPKCSAFNEALFDPCWVATREMCLLTEMFQLVWNTFLCLI